MTNHPNRSKRTKISRDGNHVTLECDNPFTGERETTIFFVPWNGGYVRIVDDASQYPQACEGLALRGATLTATPDTLADVIRREHRRSQAAAQRELNR